MTIKQLLETRAKLAARIRQMADRINDEQRDFTAEEQDNWDQLNADYDSYTRRIDALERARDIDAELDGPSEPQPGRENRDTRRDPEGRDRPEVTDEHRNMALRAWMLSQRGESLDADHVEACRLARLNPNQRELVIPLNRRGRPLTDEEQRALSVVTGAAGEFTVPTGFANTFERALLAFGGVRAIARVMRTTSGETIEWPTLDDTGNKGSLLAENTAVGEQDLVFAQKVLGAYKYSSDLIKVPVELLQDSAFDVATMIAEALGERLGRITAEHFTTGDGSGKPQGFVPAATVGKTAASATVIAADELIDLFHSVNRAYRDNAQWAMNDLIAKVVRKLKDSDGQYLWQPGLQAGQPDMLLGRPVNLLEEMVATVATTNKTIAFGDFSKFIIRDVAAVRMRRLTERYADVDQEGFVGFSRHDSELIDAGGGAIKVLQQA